MATEYDYVTTPPPSEPATAAEALDRYLADLIEKPDDPGQLELVRRTWFAAHQVGVSRGARIGRAAAEAALARFLSRGIDESGFKSEVDERAKALHPAGHSHYDRPGRVRSEDVLVSLSSLHVPAAPARREIVPISEASHQDLQDGLAVHPGGADGLAVHPGGADALSRDLDEAVALAEEISGDFPEVELGRLAILVHRVLARGPG